MNNGLPQQVVVSDGLAFKRFDLGSARLLGAYQDKTVELDIAPDGPLPTLHIHDGNVLVGGSNMGRVHLWDIASSKQKIVQVLRHPGQ